MFDDLEAQRTQNRPRERRRLVVTVIACLAVGSGVFGARSCALSAPTAPVAPIPVSRESETAVPAKPLDVGPLEKLRARTDAPREFDKEALDYVWRELSTGAIRRDPDLKLSLAEIAKLDPKDAVGKTIETVGLVQKLDREEYASSNKDEKSLWAFSLEGTSGGPRVVVVRPSAENTAYEGKPADAHDKEPIDDDLMYRVRGVYLQKRTGTIGRVTLDEPTVVLVGREFRANVPASAPAGVVREDRFLHDRGSLHPRDARRRERHPLRAALVAALEGPRGGLQGPPGRAHPVPELEDVRVPHLEDGARVRQGRHEAALASLHGAVPREGVPADGRPRRLHQGELGVDQGQPLGRQRAVADVSPLGPLSQRRPADGLRVPDLRLPRRVPRARDEEPQAPRRRLRGLPPELLVRAREGGGERGLQGRDHHALLRAPSHGARGAGGRDAALREPLLLDVGLAARLRRRLLRGDAPAREEGDGHLERAAEAHPPPQPRAGRSRRRAAARARGAGPASAPSAGLGAGPAARRGGRRRRTSLVTPSDVRLRVEVPGRTTDVVVGAGCLARTEDLLRERFPRATRRLYVVDEGVASDDVVEKWPSGWRPDPERMVRAPAGEPAKTREVHARLEDSILDAGLTRDDVVIAVGGGAVLDVAGYAAATARRGIPWTAVPTSVVAQADAAIGGKTAVNHARGKNLLGTFHAPSLVIADVTTLRTLPARDRVAGLAEVYKSGVVGDPVLLESLVTRGAPEDDTWWVDTIARCVVVKARVVATDERDEGPRRVLNYGHTVGHALETTLGPEAMRHGEAIAIGMGVAMEIAQGRGYVGEARIEAQDQALARLGLPIRIPRATPLDALVEVMAHDKKRRAGGRHTFVLPRDGLGLMVMEDVATAEVQAALVARQERRATRGAPAGRKPSKGRS